MSDSIQISSNNVSIAWLQALRAVKKSPDKLLCVSIMDLENGIKEDPSI